MASPHAVGVAALIVGRVRHERPAQRRADARARPRRADPARHGDRHAVPEPAARSTTPDIRDRRPQYTRDLRGHAPRNGFYGDGIVNATGVAEGF